MTTVRIVDASKFTNNTGSTNEEALNIHIQELEKELGNLICLSPVIKVGGYDMAFSSIEKYYLVFRK